MKIGWLSILISIGCYGACPPAMVSDSVAKVPGLLAWWEGSDSVISGTNITKLFDKTAHGYYIEQSGAVSKSAGIRTLNGFNTCYFGGANWLSNSFTINQPSTVFWFGRVVSAGAGLRLWDGITANTIGAYGSTATDPKALTMYAGTAYQATCTPQNDKWGALACCYNGATSVSYWNGSQQDYAGNVGAVNSAGFCLGGEANGTFLSTNETSLVAIWSRKLNAAEIGYASRVSGRQFAVSMAIPKVVADGDSRSVRTWEPYAMSDASIAAVNYNCTVSAVSGNTVSNRCSAINIAVAPYFSASNTKNVVVIWAGVNSASLEAKDATAIWDDLEYYCDTVRALGFKVVICSEIDAQDAAHDAVGWHTTIWPALNTLIAGDWANHADALADLGSNANLQDATNTTYFNADKLHLTAVGYALVASIVAPAIASLP